MKSKEDILRIRDALVELSWCGFGNFDVEIETLNWVLDGA